MHWYHITINLQDHLLVPGRYFAMHAANVKAVLIAVHGDRLDTVVYIIGTLFGLKLCAAFHLNVLDESARCMHSLGKITIRRCMK